MTVTVDRHLSIAEVGVGGFTRGPLDGHQANRVARNLNAFGGALLGTLNASEILGLAAEVAGYVDSSGRGQTVLAGPRVRTRLIRSGTTNWRLFAQVLSGSQRADAWPHRRVLQPGVGADDYLRNGMTLHVEYAYTFAPGEDRGLATGRFLVGFALPLGSR